MKLIITEKPSVARDIAKVLKVPNKKEGYFFSDTTLITWAFGHLIQLSHAQAYDPKYEKWDLADLPIIPDPFKLEVGGDSGTKAQFEVISKLLTSDKVTEVICATDAGREGELIFRHIYTLSGSQKPIKRLWISSQTDTAIKEGFDKLKEGKDFESLYDSALSRSEADWLVGINATRAYTRRFSFGKGVMSVGRVQTPVLKMIVDRFKANADFVPETYFEIQADICHHNGTFKGLWVTKEKESRLKTQEDADKIVAELKTAKTGTILSLTKKEVAENPPLLYDLTELQKDANKTAKLSADQTLKLMQSLYETHKILTYPRTSSRYLSSDIQPKIKNLFQTISNLDIVQPFTDTILKRPIPNSKRIFDDAKVTDHHAIIPTDKKPDLSQLSKEELIIYTLVIKRFVAAFLDNCQKEHTEIISQIGPHWLISKGTIIRDQGWRAVYQNDPTEDDDLESPKKKKKGKKGTEDTEAMLPIVNETDPIKSDNEEALKKQTKAPPLFTEAGILAAMETAGKTIEDDEMRQAMKDCGLGTPATRAQILERLIKVQYIERQKNNLVPTPKGIELIQIIQDPELLSPELTGSWEQKLNQIVKKQYTRAAYMTEIKTLTDRIITNVKGASYNRPIELQGSSLGKCPLCEKGQVVETKMAYTCNQWKVVDCKFAIWKKIAQKDISETMAKNLLTKGETQVLKGFTSKMGKPFDAALVLKQGKVEFKFEPRTPANASQPVSNANTGTQHPV
jgi:DNA topoisomerase-3